MKESVSAYDSALHTEVCEHAVPDDITVLQPELRLYLNCPGAASVRRNRGR